MRTRTMHHKLGLWIALLLFAAGSSAGAEDSSPLVVQKGELVEGISCLADPTQTYTLYLPSNYDPARSWPALVIFDPRGRSVRAAELFRSAAEDYGWILISSNDTRSDGPMEPNLKALNALWPEVLRRYPTDHDRVYLSGFSGGAMLAWAMGYRTGQVAGVIAAGGRFEPENYEQKLEFPVFGAVGDLDFNYPEMQAVHAQLKRWGTDTRLEIFPGPHSWMPQPVAYRGIEFMERLAMRDGLVEADLEQVEAWLASDLVTIRELEEEGERSRAVDRLYSMESSYRGLIDTSVVVEARERLEADPRTLEERRERSRWDDFETGLQERFFRAYGEVRVVVPPWNATTFARKLGLADLEDKARDEGYKGIVARRLLETVFTQTSFYLTNELFERSEYQRAVGVLGVAARIHPDRFNVQYQYACALARTGRTGPALDALERSVELGFPSLEWIAKDPDLESLRSEERFARLLE